MYEGERVVILVVQDEEAFAELLQHFPMDHYNLMFATDPAEALALCEMRDPRLIVVPTSFAGGGLADVLAEVRSENALILGVTESAEDVDAALDQTDLFDEVVCIRDGEKLGTTARELLKERRTRPRINLEFPIHIGDRGEGIVREFSATSLRVETAETLRTGSVVTAKIGWGPRPVTFEAFVGRIHDTLFFGQKAVILHLTEKDGEARKYLDELVRRVVELQYILAGNEEQEGKLRGTSAWDLARRAEATLRDSKGLRIRESGELIVENDDDEDVTEPTHEEQIDSGRLEGRYAIGEKVGRWGVGDVYKATHTLLERPVMLKRLRDDLRDDENAGLRLELEARVAAAFASKNTVDVLDFGSDGQGGLYYAMEALSGETLASALEEERHFTSIETASLGVHLTYALARLHLRGGGHYDLCPENVFLKRTVGTTVTPILINVAGPDVWTQSSPTYSQGVDYRPPDAPLSAPIPYCDIYALAKILHEMLPSPPTSDQYLTIGDEDLAEVLRMTMAADKTERIQDAQALREALVRSLSLLQMDSTAEQTGTLSRPSAIGPPRPSQLASIPAPDLSDTYLERVMAFEIGKNPSPGPLTSLAPPPMGSFPGGQTLIKAVAPPAASGPPPPPPLPMEAADDLLEEVNLAPPPLPSMPRPDAPPSPARLVTASPWQQSHPVASPPPRPPPGAPSPPSHSSNTTGANLAEQDRQATLPTEPTGAHAGPRNGLVMIAIVAAIGMVLLVAIGTGLLIWQPWSAGPEDDGMQARLNSGVSHDASPREPLRDAAQTEKTVGLSDAEASGSKSDASARQKSDDGTQQKSDAGALPSDGSVEEQSPAARRRTLVSKARRRIRHGLYDQATDLLNEAASIRNGSDIQVLLSQVYEKRGRTRSAIYFMKLALSYSPSNARYHDRLGSLMIKHGERTRACRSFRQSLKINAGLKSAKRHVSQYCRR